MGDDLSYWKSSTRLRRLVDELLCLLRLMVARPKLSLRLQPPLLLQLGQLQLQVGVVNVTEVREQGHAATSVQ